VRTALGEATEERHADTIPIGCGVISDGQTSIRHAVARALPGVPHQLCQCHYLREAAKPIFAADRHAKKELKKRVRGVCPIERSLEGQTGAQAEAARGYCLAVRSALTDDGRAPLAAASLKLKERLEAVVVSLERVEQTGGAEGPARAGQQGQGAESAARSAAAPAALRLAGDRAPMAPIQSGYARVHHAAHLLANHDERDGAALYQAYHDQVLLPWQAHDAPDDPLAVAAAPSPR
jgi:hypothetical protein